jgi:2-C-methyl-D-erythritol 4-phosphate cytidylyltransferase/2-C-methyl-D-erythritol 2,4-cyclodiphosphate synthase
MTFSAIVVAAGTGSRAGGNKQWRTLGGKPVLRWSVEALLAAGAEVIVVTGPTEADQANEALAGLDGWRRVDGGATRADSVRNGLAVVTGDGVVMIHDAARPGLSQAVIQRLLAALESADGALPVLPVADTLKQGRNGVASGTADRSELWRAQTPQAFRTERLRAAFTNWPADQAPTDDCAVVERDGGKITMIEGEAALMKLTYPEDFQMAEALLLPPMRTRVGMGFDAHRWGPGSSVWLCGVEIPHSQTLIGHSDADAGLHALTDAILGALCAGDIGDHFPPTDPKWKGASSDLFLEHAAGLVAERGGQVVHVDVTLICEQPKVKPHREAMRDRLAKILSLPLDAVSVKATTTEAMGFTGRGEGLAAQAVATIELPA